MGDDIIRYILCKDHPECRVEENGFKRDHSAFLLLLVGDDGVSFPKMADNFLWAKALFIISYIL